MERAVRAQIRGKGYAGGARGGFSLAVQHETKPFSRTAYSAVTWTSPTAPVTVAGGAMARWHSTQLAAEHWS